MPEDHDAVYSVAIGGDDDHRFKAYLYSHSFLHTTVSVGRRTAYLFRTVSTVSRSQAQDSAAYQCARLQSGLFAIVCEGQDAEVALNLLKRWVTEEIDSVGRIYLGVDASSI
jgi:hypothetical protein